MKLLQISCKLIAIPVSFQQIKIWELQSQSESVNSLINTLLQTLEYKWSRIADCLDITVILLATRFFFLYFALKKPTTGLLSAKYKQFFKSAVKTMNPSCIKLLFPTADIT